MNALVNATPNQTMTSKQIAVVVDSRHDSVKRTIERLANQSVISFTPSVETSHEGSGARPVEVYVVNERDSYVVVAQLCLSLQQVSDLSGIKKHDIWEMESGKKADPTAKTLIKLANALSITPAHLLQCAVNSIVDTAKECDK